MKRLLIGAAALALASFALGYWAHSPESVSIPVQVAQAHAAKADTIYRDSLHVLERWHTRYLPSHDSASVALDRLDSITARPIQDTLSHPTIDSVRRDLFTVRMGLAVADSTVHHCLGTVAACEGSGAAKDTVIWALLADRPSRLSQFLKYAEVAGVAYLIGRLSPQLKVPVLHVKF